jgi:NADH-quinone oxidoreductase subunit F
MNGKNIQAEDVRSTAALSKTHTVPSSSEKIRFLVCNDIGCQGLGNHGILKEFEERLEDWFELRPTGCKGLCARGPIVEVQPSGVVYFEVKPKDVPLILEKTRAGEVYENRLYRDPKTRERIAHLEGVPFYHGQKRVVLGVSGAIEALSLDEYRERANGYSGLAKALALKPEEVVDIIAASGLRGRGGGGFPTGKKWRSVQSQPETIRYIICNGDEGDPGAFMDRSVMQGAPFLVIEGMSIGAYAVGAHEGFIYVRDEYPIAIDHLSRALDIARREGFLGRDILGSGFDFDISIKRGAGAFVCGESSALMRSIEGKIGEPNEKYIHASERGLWDKPTVLNNVETFATVPFILRRGADWFRSLGTESSPGTKIFSLVGKIKNTGLIEVEMGTSISTIVNEIGGGIPHGRPFKAVQTGGPSGGCIPASHADTAVDFDSLTELGSMIGSGGMIVMDDHDCMVEVARYYTAFLVEESCGKCTPCREGLRQILSILERITHGEGQKEDLATLRELGEYVTESSLCGLGKSAANPLLSTLRYFEEEYLDHIEHKHCTAGVCKNLTNFRIDQDSCTSCGLCLQVCPADAIMVNENRYSIDAASCVTCGECRNVCRFDAVVW